MYVPEVCSMILEEALTPVSLQNYIKAKRFFVGEPVWMPYNRPSDSMDCRKDNVKKLEDNEFSTK